MQAESLKGSLLKGLGYLFLGALILFIIAFTFLPKYTKIKELNQENRILAKRIESLEKQNKELQEKADLSYDDTFYLEKIAREELGAVKENEVAITIEE